MRKDLNKSKELEPKGALMIGHIQENTIESKEQDSQYTTMHHEHSKKLHLLQM